MLIKTQKPKENFADNQFQNSLRPFDVYQFFLSAKVKRWTIITYKHGIYELSHKLPRHVRAWGALVHTQEKTKT